VRESVTPDKDYWKSRKDYKKVIASTDSSLNLPSFPHSFLEEYVGRYNSKQEMNVEVEYKDTLGICSDCGAEQLLSYIVCNYNGICHGRVNPILLKIGNQISIRFKEEKGITPIVKYTLGGERMYSRSEVESLCKTAFEAGEAYRTGSCEGFKQIHPTYKCWIKENLK
jgi:hypothetical protein